MIQSEDEDIALAAINVILCSQQRTKKLQKPSVNQQQRRKLQNPSVNQQQRREELQKPSVDQQQNREELQNPSVNQQQRKKRKKRIWSSPHLDRSNYNVSILRENLTIEGSCGQLKIFSGMSSEDFEKLLGMICCTIKKQDTNFRQAIPPDLRLLITLRFLSSGDSYPSLVNLFKTSQSSIADIIPKVCSELIAALESYVELPKLSDSWLKVSKDFYEKWNFPHCLGAVDGRHCVIKKSKGDFSEFSNYKGNFSLVLLAIVDSQYNFLFADVDCPGRIPDGGVFRNSLIYKMMETGELNFPHDSYFPGSDVELPYIFTADDAFPLGKHIMKPYSGYQYENSVQGYYNYRISRARIVVEHAFRILFGGFGVLRKIIELNPENAKKVILACIYLHNYLRKRSSVELYSAGKLDSQDCEVFSNTLFPQEPDISPITYEAENIRGSFCRYFDKNKIEYQGLQHVPTGERDVPLSYISL